MNDPYLFPDSNVLRNLLGITDSDELDLAEAELSRASMMLLTFFVEHYGYFFNQELLAESAGYMRNAFVMASLDKYAEQEHLERILMDAVSDTPIQYSNDEDTMHISNNEKYSQYKSVDYKTIPHEYREE